MPWPVDNRAGTNVMEDYKTAFAAAHTDDDTIDGTNGPFPVGEDDAWAWYVCESRVPL